MKEIWKPVRTQDYDFEGLYSISNQGRVYSHRTKQFLQPTISKNGYRLIRFSIKSKAYLYYLHRLVAETFIPNPDNLQCVNHKTCNLAINSANALEWCSYSYNNTYADAEQKRAATRAAWTDEKRAEIKENHQRAWTDEKRAKQSKTMKEIWSNEEYRNRRPKTYRKHSEFAVQFERREEFDFPVDTYTTKQNKIA